MMSSAWLSVLAKMRVLGTSFASRKNFRQLVTEGADDGADLVWVDDIAVKLRCGIDLVLVLRLPALPARQALALFNLLAALIVAPCLVRSVSMT